MYKREETINQILKNRNLKKLKNKARLLKNHCFKQDIEIFDHLQFVCSKFKTKKSTQAIKKKIKEKKKNNEEHTHFQYIVTIEEKNEMTIENRNNTTIENLNVTIEE